MTEEEILSTVHTLKRASVNTILRAMRKGHGKQTAKAARELLASLAAEGKLFICATNAKGTWYSIPPWLSGPCVFAFFATAPGRDLRGTLRTHSADHAARTFSVLASCFKLRVLYDGQELDLEVLRKSVGMK